MSEWYNDQNLRQFSIRRAAIMELPKKTKFFPYTPLPIIEVSKEGQSYIRDCSGLMRDFGDCDLETYWYYDGMTQPGILDLSLKLVYPNTIIKKFKLVFNLLWYWEVIEATATNGLLAISPDVVKGGNIELTNSVLPLQFGEIDKQTLKQLLLKLKSHVRSG